MKRLVYASAPAAALVTYVMLLVWEGRRVATQSWFSRVIVSDDVRINSDGSGGVTAATPTTRQQVNTLFTAHHWIDL